MGQSGETMKPGTIMSEHWHTGKNTIFCIWAPAFWWHPKTVRPKLQQYAGTVRWMPKNHPTQWGGGSSLLRQSCQCVLTCFMISEWRSDRQDTGVMSSGDRVLTIMYWSLDTLVTGTGPGNDVLSIYTWTGSNCVFAMPTFLYCTLQSLAQLCAVGIWEIVGIYLFVRDKNKHCVWMEFRCNCSFLWWLVGASWTYHGNTMEMW
jgi:hypothetical protein